MHSHSCFSCFSFARNSLCSLCPNLSAASPSFFRPIPVCGSVSSCAVPLMSMVVPRFFCVPFYDLARSKCLFCPSTHATPFPCPSFSLRQINGAPNNFQFLGRGRSAATPSKNEVFRHVASRFWRVAASVAGFVWASPSRPPILYSTCIVVVLYLYLFVVQACIFFT